MVNNNVDCDENELTFNTGSHNQMMSSTPKPKRKRSTKLPPNLSNDNEKVNKKRLLLGDAFGDVNNQNDCRYKRAKTIRSGTTCSADKVITSIRSKPFNSAVQIGKENKKVRNHDNITDNNTNNKVNFLKQLLKINKVDKKPTEVKNKLTLKRQNHHRSTKRQVRILSSTIIPKSNRKTQNKYSNKEANTHKRNQTPTRKMISTDFLVPSIDSRFYQYRDDVCCNLSNYFPNNPALKQFNQFGQLNVWYL
jgi:hypothetical protein